MVGFPEQKMRRSDMEVVTLVDDMYVMDNCPNELNEWCNLCAKHPVIESYESQWRCRRVMWAATKER